MFDLGISIRTRLARKNLSKSEFARITVVSPQYISKLCTGKKEVSLQKLMWFSEFFDVPLSEFIRWGE